MDRATFEESVRAEIAADFARGPHPDSPLFQRLRKRPESQARSARRESDDAYNCPRGERRPAMPTTGSYDE